MLESVGEQVVNNYVTKDGKSKMIFAVNRAQDVLVTNAESNNSLDYYLPTAVDTLTNPTDVRPFKLVRQAEGTLTDKEKNIFSL